MIIVHLYNKAVLFFCFLKGGTALYKATQQLIGQELRTVTFPGGFTYSLIDSFK